MRRAGRVVAEMLDRISAAVRPGVTTAELDAIGRGCSSGGAHLELPRLPRLPRRHLRLAQRRDRARHPGRPRARRGRHHLDRLRRHRRGLARRRRLHRGRGQHRRRGAAPDRRRPRPPWPPASRSWSTATGSTTSARPSSGWPRPPVLRRREYIGHAIGRRCTRSPGAQLRAAGPGRQAEGRERLRHRADGQRRQRRDPHRWTTTGPSSPPTAAVGATSSTPSPSPTTAPRSSPSRSRDRPIRVRERLRAPRRTRNLALWASCVQATATSPRTGRRGIRPPTAGIASWRPVARPVGPGHEPGVRPVRCPGRRLAQRRRR